MEREEAEKITTKLMCAYYRRGRVGLSRFITNRLMRSWQQGHDSRDAELQSLKSEKERAEAACAEMRRIIGDCLLPLAVLFLQNERGPYKELSPELTGMINLAHDSIMALDPNNPGASLLAERDSLARQVKDLQGELAELDGMEKSYAAREQALRGEVAVYQKIKGFSRHLSMCIFWDEIKKSQDPNKTRCDCGYAAAIAALNPPKVDAKGGENG